MFSLPLPLGYSISPRDGVHLSMTRRISQIFWTAKCSRIPEFWQFSKKKLSHFFPFQRMQFSWGTICSVRAHGPRSLLALRHGYHQSVNDDVADDDDVGEQASGPLPTEPRYCTATSRTSPSGTRSDSGQQLTSIYCTKNELRPPGLSRDPYIPITS